MCKCKCKCKCMCACACACGRSRTAHARRRQECDNEACGFDGGDCSGVCAPGCQPKWLKDGVCDDECNTGTCSYDGGDCLKDGRPTPQQRCAWLERIARHGNLKRLEAARAVRLRLLARELILELLRLFLRPRGFVKGGGSRWRERRLVR